MVTSGVANIDSTITYPGEDRSLEPSSGGANADACTVNTVASVPCTAGYYGASGWSATPTQTQKCTAGAWPGFSPCVRELRQTIN